MKFYDELSKVYDIVFKKDEGTVRFLNNKLKQGSKVLDLACGTGTYSIELAKEGHNVSGMDLDGEMIKLANIKSEVLNTRFLQGDMRKAKDVFKDERFNMIFCIGNSLVHLQDKTDIKKLICDIYNMLEDKGAMIIQIINFDRIMKNNITSLPTIDRKDEGVKFVRNYRHSEDKSIIYFDTELILLKDGNEDIYRNSVPLLPLQSGELVDMAREAGFKDIIINGEFSEKSFDEDSYALVLSANK
jgi:ubiquinone/menaquinone biosynthesis C-methylase UbiE